MIGIRNDGTSRQLIIANDICHSFGVSVVAHPQRPPHLLPEILNFYLLQRSLDKLVNFWQNILLPVLEQLVLLDLGRLRFEQIFTLYAGMSVNTLLLHLVARI